MAPANTADFGEGTVTIRRTLNVPRALLWRAWTGPMMMVQWFGSRMFTTPVCDLDVSVGGNLCIIMRGSDGNDYPMHGVFTEVVPETRLVFTNIPTDGSGNHLMEGETRVTFADAGGQTELTVAAHMAGCVPMAKQMLAGMGTGWTQTIDKLGEMLGKR